MKTGDVIAFVWKKEKKKRWKIRLSSNSSDAQADREMETREVPASKCSAGELWFLIMARWAGHKGTSQNSALRLSAWQEMCQRSPYWTFLDLSHLCDTLWVFRSLSYSLFTHGSLGFLQLCEISHELLFIWSRNNAAEEAHTRDTSMTSYKINQRCKRWFDVCIRKITGTASEI